MARPLRLEFPGAVYHVTSRGDRREDIFLSDDDRRDWLEVLGVACARFNWVVHAFCQMTNHYHLLVETMDGNLSGGMRQLNGIMEQPPPASDPQVDENSLVLNEQEDVSWQRATWLRPW